MFFGTVPAFANTNYRGEAITTVPDGTTVQMGRMVVTGTSTLTFTGENDRAEFRLPSDFYITSAGLYDEDNDQYSVSVRVVRGFQNAADPSNVTIRPIDEDSYNAGHYGGFEIIVNNPSGADGYVPELMIYFNKVYVPQGFRGAVEVTVEPGEDAGFSDGEVTIARVEEVKLSLSAEEKPSFVTNQRVGPILISENMASAFDYIELSLPAGFAWVEDSATLDPGLGLDRDYDNDGSEERDFKTSVSKDKYGYSILKVERTKQESTAKGTLRIECDVEIDEDRVAHGDVFVQVEGDAEPTTKSLMIGDYEEQSVSVTAGTPSKLYGGLFDQDIADIIIEESAPGSLMGDDQTVTLELPDWAEWSEAPEVKLEGSSELKLSLDNGRAFLVGDENRRARFYIVRDSKNNEAKIVIRKGKVNLTSDAQGDLKVTVKISRTGEEYEFIVGNTGNLISLSSPTKPVLQPSAKAQRAGDIELREVDAQALLARDLWVKFPNYVNLEKTPTVRVSAGNLIIGKPKINNDYDEQVLIIPIEFSSSQAATLLITDIVYTVEGLAPFGDVKVAVGGPAVNEETEDMPASSDDWLMTVANATLEKVENPGAQEIVLRLNDASYTLNGQSYQMDVAPYATEGRTFVPLRFVGLALGIADHNIFWDQATQTASLLKNGVVVQFKLDDMAIYLSRVRIPTDAAAHMHMNRVMVPLRSVAMGFGVDVAWEPATKTVRIINN